MGCMAIVAVMEGSLPDGEAAWFVNEPQYAAAKIGGKATACLVGIPGISAGIAAACRGDQSFVIGGQLQTGEAMLIGQSMPTPQPNCQVLDKAAQHLVTKTLIALNKSHGGKYQIW